MMLPQAPFPESIDGEALRTLPLRSYEGPIHLIDRDEQVHEAVHRLAHERVLGFDIETKPSFRPGENYPPALVQLAAAHEVFIFQLTRLNDVTEIYRLLAQGSHIKAGIALRDDLKKLRERQEFQPAGFVEIADLSRAVGIKQTGLRPLAAILLGFRVSKREQRSNWGRRELTDSQVRYAATDAWVSRDLYVRLKTLVAEFKRDVPPDSPAPPESPQPPPDPPV
jgi:ribonuclease D